MVADNVVMRLPQLVKLVDKQFQSGRGPVLGAPAVNNVTYRAPAAFNMLQPELGPPKRQRQSALLRRTQVNNKLQVLGLPCGHCPLQAA